LVETRQLEYFVTVAEELNFTRAAARLFAVQSTVSAGVRALEDELGEALFVRSTKRVALTPAGEALLSDARAAIKAVDRVRGSAAQTRAGIRGRLRVGIFSQLIFLDLAAMFGEFHQLYPFVDLQLGTSTTGSTGFADDVRRGRIDVAFMGLPRADLGSLDVHEVASGELIAIVPSDHPLAGKSTVSLAELAPESFVDSPAGFGNRIVVDRAFAAAGLQRAVSTQVSDLADIPRFVAAGLGVAVVPDIMVLPAAGATFLRLSGPRNEWLLSAVTRPSPSPAVAALLRLLADRVAAG
jgi:DNA-binding transcriptional LysR family regulator